MYACFKINSRESTGKFCDIVISTDFKYSFLKIKKSDKSTGIVVFLIRILFIILSAGNTDFFPFVQS